jgi:hypothetical protein
MTAEDLTIIEKAGRRCSGCQSGRHWRRLEVLRPEGRDPLVTCRACRPRLAAAAAAATATVQAPAATPGSGATPGSAATASNGAGASHTDGAPSRASSTKPRPRRGHRPSSPQREDRLKRALRELPPGTHSTGFIARAAGLNKDKVVARLRALEAAGEVQRVGNKWSTERPSTDLEAAFDRLQARTANLRIIRPQQRRAE